MNSDTKRVSKHVNLDSELSQPVKAKRARWILVLMLASFVLPFVIGSQAYKHGWFSGGATNKGHLLSPPMALADLALTPDAGSTYADLRTRWWLLYIIPEQCAEVCQQSLTALPELQSSLGREQGRVGILLVKTERSALVPTITVSPALRVFNANADVLAAKLQASAGSEAIGRWYVLDPMGWIMLDYAAAKTDHEILQRAQNVLDDLQKLLKASRIG